MIDKEDIIAILNDDAESTKLRQLPNTFADFKSRSELKLIIILIHTIFLLNAKIYR